MYLFYYVGFMYLRCSLDGENLWSLIRAVDIKKLSLKLRAYNQVILDLILAYCVIGGYIVPPI